MDIADGVVAVDVVAAVLSPLLLLLLLVSAGFDLSQSGSRAETRCIVDDEAERPRSQLAAQQVYLFVAVASTEAQNSSEGVEGLLLERWCVELVVA